MTAVKYSMVLYASITQNLLQDFPSNLNEGYSRTKKQTDRTFEFKTESRVEARLSKRDVFIQL